LIALFVSVSGVAYAAATIGTSDIKNGAVTAAKLHTDAVTTPKIKDGAVTAAKLRTDAVTTPKIKDGAVSGAKIKNGAVNKAKIGSNAVGADELGTVVQRTASISVPAGSARIVSKDCEPGELALSVGANWDGAQTVGPVLQAATFLNGAGEPTGGSAAGRNGGAGARNLTVIVSCLAP
jgi:hypothetical protein